MYILLSEFLYSLQFLRPPYANEHITRGTRMTPRKQQVSKLIGDCPNRGRPFQTRIWVCPHLDWPQLDYPQLDWGVIWTTPNWPTSNWTTLIWTTTIWTSPIWTNPNQIGLKEGFPEKKWIMWEKFPSSEPPLWGTSEYFEVLWVLWDTFGYFEVLLAILRYLWVLWDTSEYFEVLLGTLRYFWVLWGTSEYFEILLST